MSVVQTKVLELWAYRELFAGLVEREVQARYKGSALGFCWSLLTPLLMLGVYTLVFAQVMRVAVPHYGLFLLAGLLPWGWFAAGTAQAAGSVVAHANLVKKVAFPHELLPLVAVTAHLIHYMLALPLLLAFALAQGVSPALAWLWLPAIVAVQFVFTVGLGLVVATANVFFRDVEQLLGVGLLAWFYLTPIVYPLTMVPARFQALMALNPLAGLMGSYQQVLLEGVAPPAAGLLYALAVGLVLLAGGYALFLSRRYDFAEVI